LLGCALIRPAHRVGIWEAVLPVKFYLYLAQIIMAITIIVLVLLQAKDAGLGNVFGGGDMGVARTRRGVEKTLFNATIGIGIAFLLLCVITVKITG
jgi:preprotein translocase subunit SecG